MTKDELLTTLKQRFEEYANRHEGIAWDQVEERLNQQEKKLWSLMEMEETGGEPDVIGIVKETGEIMFADCSAETPAGRRNCCYDVEGQKQREKKGLFPEGGSAIGKAAEMGIEVMDEQEYKYLQTLGEFDLKTSSWLKTPLDIRAKEGAIFGDRRYGHVFVYHNGANSFYSARAFRGILKL